jgi:hypothetical protein
MVPVLRSVWLAGLLCAVLPGCGERGERSAASAAPDRPLASVPDGGPGDGVLAAARLAVARKALAAEELDEALLWSVAALRADEDHAEAREFAVALLRDGTWLFPEYRIAHPAPIGFLRFLAPSSLWVALEGSWPTVLRRDTASEQIDAVLFPARGEPIRHLAADPGHRHLVVTRGDRRLLCDALNLKPVAVLGSSTAALPPSLTAFSDDGLLVAVPTCHGSGSWSWSIHDTTTGQLLRQAQGGGRAGAWPLCSSLDRAQLRVLGEDGSVSVIPVSPVLPEQCVSANMPLRIRQAVFAGPDLPAFAALDPGPGREPAIGWFPSNGEGSEPPTAAQLLASEAWSHHPCLWRGPLGTLEGAPRVSGRNGFFVGGKTAPIRCRSEIGALIASANGIFSGERDGTVTFHRLLPPLGEQAGPNGGTWCVDMPVDSLERLAGFLTGLRLVDDAGRIESIAPAQRIALLTAPGEAAEAGDFAGIPMRSWREVAGGLHPRETGSQALAPLLRRIEVCETVRASEERERDFREGNREAVAKWIGAAGASGAAAALNLQLALAAERPEWIGSCLQRANGLPPSLLKLARARLAWLRGDTATAMELWNGEVPADSELRAAEDWIGWEQADFTAAFAKLRADMLAERRKTALPPEPTLVDMKRVLGKLEEADTMRRLGKARYAHDCLTAAMAMAEAKDFARDAAALASLARQLGHDPAPCLRAEAAALTTAGDFTKARERWVQLISETPQAAHLPDDYAEAAYTAFENTDARQAMDILETGMHRFPDHSAFAHRAGWIALLAGYPDVSLRFLSEGQRNGFEKDTIEHATALMAVAAARCGQEPRASALIAELARLDPAWAEPDAADALDWPADLKESLRDLLRTQHQPGRIKRGP